MTFGDLRAILHAPSPTQLDWERLHTRFEAMIFAHARGLDDGMGELEPMLDYAAGVFARSTAWASTVRQARARDLLPSAHPLYKNLLRCCNALVLSPDDFTERAWMDHVRLDQVVSIDCAVGVTCRESCVELLQRTPSLRSLSLHDTKDGTPSLMLEALLDSTPELPSLRALSLNLLCQGDHIVALARSGLLSGLDALRFHMMKLSGACVDELMSALGDVRLRRLDFDEVHVGIASVGRALRAPALSELEELALTWTGEGESIVHALSGAPCAKTLRHLDLRHNQLTSMDLAALGELEMPQLRELILHDQAEFDEEGQPEAFGTFIASSIIPRLEAIDVRGMWWVHRSDLTSLIERAVHATSIKISGCDVDGSLLTAVADACRARDVRGLHVDTPMSSWDDDALSELALDALDLPALTTIFVLGADAGPSALAALVGAKHERLPALREVSWVCNGGVPSGTPPLHIPAGVEVDGYYGEIIKEGEQEEGNRRERHGRVDASV